MKKLLPLVLAGLLTLSGCGKTEFNTSQTTATANTTSTVKDVDFAENNADMFTNRDLDSTYDVNQSALIQLNGDSASCSSNGVEISGTTVTIKDEGTYILSGVLNDGMIIVNADEKDKPQLVFNGVQINSETSAPLYILEADKVVVTLAENTDNTLSNGGTFTQIDDNNIDGTVFSKQDLTFNGTGSLTVSSPSGHGIVGKDDLVLTSGTYTVNSASHGLDANDSVRIKDALVTVVSGKDGIHAKNSDDTTLGFVYVASGDFEISAEGDGISAKAYMQIENGTFDITSGGGSVNATKQTSDNWGDFMGGRDPGGHMSQSYSTETDDTSTSIKALKSTGDILINNGNFTIDSADDAVHSNASITVNDGDFEIASGDDGFHADETLTVVNGKINITESYEGLEALDIFVTGGEVSLVASDDGLNAAGGTDSSGFGGHRGNDQFGRGGMGGQSTTSNGSIKISGGNLYVKASGDGIDANGTLEISGGKTVVTGPTQGDTATLDYDVSATITGGTFIGTGGAGMAQTFSNSQQGVVTVNAGNQSANTQITLKDSKANTIISHTPELDFSVVIISSPDLVSGETYSLTIGSVTDEVTAK